MTVYDLHEPSYDATTTDDRDAPQLEDFDTDDLGEVEDHFLSSADGFPPSEFGDLKLPVVSLDGALNENALQAAHGGAHSVEAIDDVDDETASDVEDLVEDLAESAFDEDVGS